MAKWYIYEKFTGFKTKADAEKVDDGANVNGQNTSINDGDRISVRNLGTEVFGDTSEFGTNPITSQHTFRKRSGTNILMSSTGTYLIYLNPSSNTWESLKNDYTSGKKFGYADYNIGTDLVSWCYFGNAVEEFGRWNGNYCKLTSAVSIGDVTINVDSTTGFTATGNIVLAGVSHAYSSITPTTFVLTGTSSVNVSSGRGVAQAPELYASPKPKGNIYLVCNNRLFISGVVGTEQAVYFSKYGDALDFTSTSLVTGSTATASGIFNLGEGGGAVNGAIQDEGAIYFFKNSIIYKATLTDELYTLDALKPFDGKSQGIGALSGTVFTGDNYVFLVTPDGQFMSLQRIETIDYPQIIPLSDQIKPTVNSFNNDACSGITYKNKAYFFTKSSSSVNANDVVLVWDIKNQCWESPITGWNISCATVYNNGTTEDLYLGDSLTNKVYKVNTTPTDGVDQDNDVSYSVEANWRSKQFTFGDPQSLKECYNIFIEGYISENSSLDFTVLLDDNGFTQELGAKLIGTDTDFLFNSAAFNAFGLTPFGYERFGSQDDQSGKKKFRIYLKKGSKINQFYNLQLDFHSSGENQQWEIIRFGFEVQHSPNGLLKKLIKTFS